MIGSVSVGSMGDNQVEGWPGYRLDEISNKADLSLPMMPNVVCIYAGANDVYQNYKLDAFAQRMADLIDKILSKVPETTIIVSTLMHNDQAGYDAIMVPFNANLVDIVGSRSRAGKKVFLVNSNTTVSISSHCGLHGLQNTIVFKILTFA